ncbi:hypothetical protein AT00_17250 [Pseudoalteromonas lipolytica SCSIO 04301]|uniref:General secretion pathway protein K n=2 Tax=Pseudoalteromonas lipolytica TaxID=570156 RepID=A0ABY1GKM4_9GAMM|nr:type II secretion system protein GspK [Pseudoalteromonas lipolytica]EWH04896.1 hypothetical protein AT00_17250 [Pseudoalteromonas lipolytica SCSIO 04301]MBE0349618.1 general secretion pathway protein K [Pseudoalteromonas lipolytica LMEB 39]SFT78119.1 general secretion pathway protein K [Pseudoalteromonas lipolytica]
MAFKGKKQQGVALIMVLMMAAIMAVVMIYMTGKGQNKARLAALVKNNNNAMLAIESAQAELVFSFTTSQFSILGPNKTYQGQASENKFTDNFTGQINKQENYTVQVQDISGLVSLMPFNERDFKQLLVKNGVSNDRQLAILDRLIDWQDKDSLTHLSGAERGDYELPFLPSNSVLQSKRELAYILDDTQLYERIAPYLSFYGQEYLVPYYVPNSLHALFSTTQPTAQQGAEASPYPSGRYLVDIKAEQVSLRKRFTILRGQDSFRPFFIVDEMILQ